MKKIILNLLLLCATFFLQAQSRHNITIEGGPGASMQSPSSIFATSKMSINWGGRFGINYLLRINDKISIKTGLRTIALGERTFFSNLKWGSEYKNNTWKLDPSLPHELWFHRHEYSVEIPLIFHQRLSNAKSWNFYWEGGFAFTRGFAQNISVAYTGEFKGNSKSAQEFLTFSAGKTQAWAVLASIGWEKEFMPQRFFFFQPTFNFNTAKNAILRNVRWNSYLLSLETGVRWAF
jgi:hypothetical protein